MRGNKESKFAKLNVAGNNISPVGAKGGGKGIWEPLPPPLPPPPPLPLWQRHVARAFGKGVGKGKGGGKGSVGSTGALQSPRGGSGGKGA